MGFLDELSDEDLEKERQRRKRRGTSGHVRVTEGNRTFDVFGPEAKALVQDLRGKLTSGGDDDEDEGDEDEDEDEGDPGIAMKDKRPAGGSRLFGGRAVGQ